ncbi:CHAT domain-containing protein [Dictyobacter aurantiacus]|uniref:CHAT domain-containing protein n=1 Tax=Dictyobacter aurantiacus TaxID=1936993 RepID=UPI0013591FDA|nr:CHAT domain-containing protein [Dictyobacter aurantiacus]
MNIDIKVQQDVEESHSYLVAATTRGRRGITEQGRFSLSPEVWRDVEPSLRAVKARDSEAQEHAQKVRDFGKYLFNCLITGNIRHLYESKKQEALRQAKVLRLQLILEPLELVSLPWELLFDEHHAEYLCLTQQPRTILTRSIKEGWSSGHSRSQVRSSLRIVGIVAAPRDRPVVGEREKKTIEQALQPLIDRNQVILTWKPGKYTELPDLRYSDRIDIFHFIGHGGFDENSRQGYLEFEDDKHLSRAISAEKFRLSLYPGTQLIVLNACETARGDYSNIAHSLASQGIPAVVAMQFKILDSASHRFAKMFYTLLAKGLTIDEAIAEARYDIHNASDDSDSLDWAAPLLYVNSSNILSFRLIEDTPLPAVDSTMNRETIELINQDTPLPAVDSTINREAISIPDADVPASLQPSENVDLPPLPQPHKKRQFARAAQQWKGLPLWGKIGAVALSLILIASAIAGMNFKKIGGLDVTSYCIHLSYEEAVEVTGKWYCTGASLTIDMAQACDWQYHENNLTADSQDPNNPISALCYDPQKHLMGGIRDMKGYCVSMGYDTFNEGKTINDWECIHQQEIDMTQACSWQYSRIYVQARKDNNDWECYSFFG